MAQFLDGVCSCRMLQRGRPVVGTLAAAICFMVSGCAALTNPIAEGIPVRYLPEELLAKPKDDAHTIPLDLLGQPQPDTYRLEPDDVLGVYIEGVLQDGGKGLNAPVQVAPLILLREQRRLPPAVGYPITVRLDGTIKLPMIDPIKVHGLSLAEAEDTIRAIYVKNKLLPEGRDPDHCHLDARTPSSCGQFCAQESGATSRWDAKD